MWLIFLHSLLFSHVWCSSLYLSHKIRHKSKFSKNEQSAVFPKSQEIQNSKESYEYHGDYSSENALNHLTQSASEHKVQHLLLKDMGLQNMPDTKSVSIKWPNHNILHFMNVFCKTFSCSFHITK